MSFLSNDFGENLCRDLGLQPVMRETATAVFLTMLLAIPTLVGCSSGSKGAKRATASPGATYHKQGMAELKKGDYSGAAECFTDLIRVEPNNPKAYVSRGMTYFYMREYQKSLSDLTEAIRLDPSDVEALANRGGVYIQIGEFDKAIADENVTIDIEPNFALAFVNRSAAYARKGDFDEAIADASRAIDLAPHYAMPYNNRGGYYLFREEWEKAMADLNEAIRLQPKMAMAYTNRGLVFFRRAQPIRAMQDFYESINLEPNLWLGHSNLASFLATCSEAKFRDGKKALQHAEKACELTSWNEPEALTSLALAYAELGDFEKAVHWQEESLNKTPLKPAKAKEKRTLILETLKQGKPFREN